MERFNIRNLGLIENVSMDFGDLTILVGPQASGKSLALETLKLVVDHDDIVKTMDLYAYIVGNSADNILNVFYGEGMSAIWNNDTQIVFGNTPFLREHLSAIPESVKEEEMFYIPAQRILSIADGRPKNFMEFDNSSPYILRMFSEILRKFMQSGMGNSDILFPLGNRLKGFLKKSFDESIFHKAQVVNEMRLGQKKMVLNIDNMNIPFMAWSAGQKEFMPLLMAFYCLSGPPSRAVKREQYKYVVIEEPEMGLHPRAIMSVLLQVLELIQEGNYKVIISTHTPVFLEFAWAFNLLKKNERGRYPALYEIFNVHNNKHIRSMLRGLFDKSIKTYYFSHDGENGKVVSKDISILDVADEDDMIADWGGLSEFASKVSDVVSKYMVNDE